MKSKTTKCLSSVWYRHSDEGSYRHRYQFKYFANSQMHLNSCVNGHLVEINGHKQNTQKDIRIIVNIHMYVYVYLLCTAIRFVICCKFKVK